MFDWHVTISHSGNHGAESCRAEALWHKGGTKAWKIQLSWSVVAGNGAIETRYRA